MTNYPSLDGLTLEERFSDVFSRYVSKLMTLFEYAKIEQEFKSIVKKEIWSLHDDLFGEVKDFIREQGEIYEKKEEIKNKEKY